MLPASQESAIQTLALAISTESGVKLTLDDLSVEIVDIEKVRFEILGSRMVICGQSERRVWIEVQDGVGVDKVVMGWWKGEMWHTVEYDLV